MSHVSFACFGGLCAVQATGPGAAEAVDAARRRLLLWHQQFTRFTATSELSRLNADPRDEVPVTEEMALFVAGVVRAAELTRGLVDATLLGELETAGYRADLRAPLPLELALRLAPARRPAAASPAARWRDVALDPSGRAVRRPPGVRLDSGGLAKGLFADLLADALAGCDDFAVDCGGDVRVGGPERPVRVASPFGDEILHTFVLADMGIATSGIGRRSWLDAGGRPAHHLLDPATGQSAFTGIVQASALAPTALEAEARAKAAVLSGPASAADWLPHGGVLVFDDGDHEVVLADLSAASELAARSSRHDH